MEKLNIDKPVEEEEEEYEVEKIVAHKVVKSGRSKAFRYFIKWLNYDDADNTWENEDNVFATDILTQYWSNLPKTDKDRILFETLQSKKKNPIILSSPSPPKVAKVITATSSPSPPSSPILAPTPKPSITSFFDKKRMDRVPTTKQATVSSSSSTSEITKSKDILQQTKLSEGSNITITHHQHQTSRKGKEKEDSLTPTIEPRVVAAAAASENGTVQKNGSSKKSNIFSSDEDEEEEGAGNKKRTRSAYTDYFTEQHKKKKRISKSPPIEDEDDDLGSNEELVEETNLITFNEALDTDPNRDWNELAIKVEYIGRELEGAPLYCAVKWKDDVVSLHSFDLVKSKRPDLVIDALVKQIYNE
ncbi:hypothetical protein BD770DRAFT_424285 [Pilaira anomala]|nr:hypothetical protein BD770DRAFT_424285 [Pilaira anomala]